MTTPTNPRNWREARPGLAIAAMIASAGLVLFSLTGLYAAGWTPVPILLIMLVTGVLIVVGYVTARVVSAVRSVDDGDDDRAELSTRNRAELPVGSGA